MGGFNASQLYLKAPSQFSKVALLCPAITSPGPYATDTEIDEYITRTNADYYNVYRALQLTARYYPTLKIWNQSSPLYLSEQILNPQFPPLYVSVGDADEYGLFEGAKKSLTMPFVVEFKHNGRW